MRVSAGFLVKWWSLRKGYPEVNQLDSREKLGSKMTSWWYFFMVFIGFLVFKNK